MQTKYILSLVAIVAIISASFIFTQNSKTESNTESINAKIGYIPTSTSLPLFVAIEKGYFKEVGVEIEPVKFEAPNLYTDSIAAGQIDFTAHSLAAGIMSIVETKNPNKFQIYGTNYTDASYPGDVIVIPKNSTATTFADLKGKTCVTLAGPQFKVIFNKLAKDAGLKASEVGQGGDIFYKELAVSEQVSALANKNADCIVGLEPIGSVALSKGVGKLLELAPIAKVLDGKFYGGIATVATNFKKNNPQTTLKVIQAMDKATKDIQSDPDSVRVFLPKYTGVSVEVANQMKIPYFRSSTDLGEVDFVGIDSLLNEFQAQGIYVQKPDFRKLRYNR
jgi:NitT/TauT family transport system substrate-binding protein